MTFVFNPTKAEEQAGQPEPARYTHEFKYTKGPGLAANEECSDSGESKTKWILLGSAILFAVAVAAGFSFWWLKLRLPNESRTADLLAKIDKLDDLIKNGNAQVAHARLALKQHPERQKNVLQRLAELKREKLSFEKDAADAREEIKGNILEYPKIQQQFRERIRREHDQAVVANLHVEFNMEAAKHMAKKQELLTRAIGAEKAANDLIAQIEAIEKEIQESNAQLLLTAEPVEIKAEVVRQDAKAKQE